MTPLQCTNPRFGKHRLTWHNDYVQPLSINIKNEHELLSKQQDFRDIFKHSVSTNQPECMQLFGPGFFCEIGSDGQFTLKAEQHQQTSL